MGDIVDLGKARGQRHVPANSSTNSGLLQFGPAQIVLYTGIQYERHGEDAGTPPHSPTLS